MHISRIQVEEGFLDGLDVRLSRGLNVVIGARGTGKTSLIELVRFCLSADNQTEESARKSLEHARSVLGGGRIIVTLQDRGAETVVTRTGSESRPRTTRSFDRPIVFSQKEIEEVAVTSEGRLALIDAFRGTATPAGVEEILAAEILSQMVEIQDLRSDMEDIETSVQNADAIEQRVKELQAKGKLLADRAGAQSFWRKENEAISSRIAQIGTAFTYVERFRGFLARTRTATAASARAAQDVETWPRNAGPDLLTGVRSKCQQAREMLKMAERLLSEAQVEVTSTLAQVEAEKVHAEAEARRLRKEIETQQEGSSALARELQALLESKEKAVALRSTRAAQAKALRQKQEKRDASLAKLEEHRLARFKERKAIARELSGKLGPEIRISVTRGGNTSEYETRLSTLLKGSGLKYVDLSRQIVEHLTPRELLEMVEAHDAAGLAGLIGTSEERAARVLLHLSSTPMFELASVSVEDEVELSLLDGKAYKNFLELSTGQRCTVVLPIVLSHSSRVVILDQPEDHLDNAFIVKTLVRALVQNERAGQVIVSSHNANIPVLGNATKVIELESDGTRGFVKVNGTLKGADVVESITRVMEGGREAFEKRAEFYDETFGQ